MKYDVIVVGGGPAGIIAAVTGRRVYGPGPSIAIIREEDPLVPCGIPYMFGTLDGTGPNAMPDMPLQTAKVDILTDQVLSLSLADKTLQLATRGKLEYEKLVLATGSQPIVPGKLPGVSLANVFSVPKSKKYLEEAHARLTESRDVVIIGGGFIGVEFADELAKTGDRNVTVVEMMPNCLWQSFDPEFCELGEKALADRGVRILTGAKVEAIAGNGKVETVKTSAGEIKADAVLVAIGARPDTHLASEAGLRLSPRGAIQVDAAMRTSDPDVLAVGDCASKTDFFSGSESGLMLASIATIEARTAGANLFKTNAMLPCAATPGAFATMIGGLVMASSGLTETEARQRNIDIKTGKAESVDRHPGTLPGAKLTKVKLVFSSLSGRLLGGQAVGGQCVGEVVNVLALAVGHRLGAIDLYLMPLGTHPLLTPAPTTYPIVGAAWDFLGQTQRS